MQPTLFRFDFSPFLTLQNEIKINDSLVFIVQAPLEYSSHFLRRIYLSGWDLKKGFYESPAPNDFPQQTKVPSAFTEFETQPFQLRHLVSQNIFVVNFDPESLIAFDYPVLVRPYEVWNSASFSGAYSVTSNTSDFFPFELFESPKPFINQNFSKEAFEFYTRIDTHTKNLLLPLTEKITQHVPVYYDKIVALNNFLKNGEYKYSLKPGIAEDGNQLSHFLFKSKKGYCTYYAFSLALMLRSIGIPARVAAGFFLQPDLATLNYFPIRANMAHAWVEVFFNDYGWISFDPTSTEIAEGENLEIQNSVESEEFLNLLEEIIENKNLLTDKKVIKHNFKSNQPITAFMYFIKKNIGILLTICFILIAVIIFTIFIIFPKLYLQYSNNSRNKILHLYSITTKFCDKHNFSKDQNCHLDRLFKLFQKAKFSPHCSSEDFTEAKKISDTLMKKKNISFKKGTHFFCIFFLIFFPCFLHAENLELSNLLSSAKNAIASENWEYALNILTVNEKLFPEESEIYYLLGSIYYNSSLFDSAYTAFIKAENFNNYSPDLYSLLSDTASYLSKDEEALVWIRKHLEKNPDDLYGWTSFGWLCYKTNRLEEGILNIHRLIDSYGPDANLCASLANLYTASFDYIQAKKLYTQAIQISQEKNQPYLSAIYYYNRSILEEVFYNFDLAYADTIHSLNSLPRASGYLMQGELEQKKLSFKAAFSLYLKAWNLDSSPLATIGVAETVLLAGHPQLALQYLQHALTQPDLFWIANYGTTTNQYKANVHKLERDIYSFIKNQEKRKVLHSLSTRIASSVRIFKFHFLTWKENAYYMIYSKDVATQYEITNTTKPRNLGIQLFIDSYYFQAFNTLKIISKRHLLSAKLFETSHVPASLPSYLLEEGRINRDISLLDDAISTLDPIWEKKYLAEALSERLKLTNRKKDDTFNAYTTLLYEISPSSFIAHDISFPVKLKFSDTSHNKSKRLKSKFKKYLKKAGVIVSDSASFTITIEVSKTDMHISLVNLNSKATIYTQVIHNFDYTKLSFTEVINNLSTGIFSIDLGLSQE